MIECSAVSIFPVTLYSDPKDLTRSYTFSYHVTTTYLVNAWDGCTSGVHYVHSIRVCEDERFSALYLIGWSTCPGKWVSMVWELPWWKQNREHELIFGILGNSSILELAFIGGWSLLPAWCHINTSIASRYTLTSSAVTIATNRLSVGQCQFNHMESLLVSGGYGSWSPYALWYQMSLYTFMCVC